MNLSHGGHLTHGSKASTYPGNILRHISYGVDPETETIDYDALARVAEEVRPKLIIAGASAYPRVIDFARFRAVADSRRRVPDGRHGAHRAASSPRACTRVRCRMPMSSPRTTHKTLRGPRGAIILCRDELAKKIDSAVFPGTQGGPLMHVIAGKAVCFGEALQPGLRAPISSRWSKMPHVLAETLAAGRCAPRLRRHGQPPHAGSTSTAAAAPARRCRTCSTRRTSPPIRTPSRSTTQSVRVTSGVRLGTPAVTTRGMGEEEMREIGALICRLIDEGEAAVPAVRAQVLDLCARFPLYPDLHM